MISRSILCICNPIWHGLPLVRLWISLNEPYFEVVCSTLCTATNYLVIIVFKSYLCSVGNYNKLHRSYLFPSAPKLLFYGNRNIVPKLRFQHPDRTFSHPGRVRLRSFRNKSSRVRFVCTDNPHGRWGTQWLLDPTHSLRYFLEHFPLLRNFVSWFIFAAWNSTHLQELPCSCQPRLVNSRQRNFAEAFVTSLCCLFICRKWPHVDR